MKALPVPSLGLTIRLGLSGLLALEAHQFHWIGLRFLVSQIVLFVSTHLGISTERVSFDTIEVQGHMIQFVVACTFVEVMLGMQPLLWRTDKSLSHNFMRMALSMSALFACNIVRIEVAQILFSLGIPWILAHDIPLGAIYFGIWIVIWRTRKWQAFRSTKHQFVTA